MPGPASCFILGHEKLSFTDCVLLTGLAVGQKAEDALKGHILGSATQHQAVIIHFPPAFCHFCFLSCLFWGEEVDENYQEKK